MHPSTILAALSGLALTLSPVLALPNPDPVAIAEADADFPADIGAEPIVNDDPNTPEGAENILSTRAQCRPGRHLVGSGCSPGAKGHTSCSADKRAVVSLYCFLPPHGLSPLKSFSEGEYSLEAIIEYRLIILGEGQEDAR